MIKKRSVWGLLTGVILGVAMAACFGHVSRAASTTVKSTEAEKASDERVEKAIEWALAVAADDEHHGYSSVRSEADENGYLDYDCSYFVSSAFNAAGFDVPANGNTGSMKASFTKVGFTWIDWAYIGDVSNLKRGDILLNYTPGKNHTEIYIGNGRLVGAHTDRGHPETGDQTGTEVSEINYYFKPWLGVLRYGKFDFPDPVVDTGSAVDPGNSGSTGSNTGGNTGGNSGATTGGNTGVSTGTQDSKESETDKQTTETPFSYQYIEESGIEIGGVTITSKYNELTGNKALYFKKGTGKTVRIRADKGLDLGIVTNGKKIYYILASKANGMITSKVFCYNTDEAASKKAFTDKSDSGISLCGYYKDKVYYVKGIDPGKLCSFDIATGKKRAVLKNVTTATQTGKYFICLPYRGDASASVMKTYDANAGKAKTICKKMMSYRLISGKLYYVEYMKNIDATNTYTDYENYVGRVVRATLSGGSRKVLLDNAQIRGSIAAITSKYIKYMTYDNVTGMAKQNKINY